MYNTGNSILEEYGLISALRPACKDIIYNFQHLVCFSLVTQLEQWTSVQFRMCRFKSPIYYFCKLKTLSLQILSPQV